jgi:hypothetical protein
LGKIGGVGIEFVIQKDLLLKVMNVGWQNQNAQLSSAPLVFNLLFEMELVSKTDRVPDPDRLQ